MSNNTELKAPAGWKLVPVEPTKAMLEAGYAGAANYSGQDEELGCWRAMLAAVPATPAQQALSDLECPPDPETVDAATVQQAAPSLTVEERDCPHCNYTGAAHCGDVADKIKACGGEVVDCSHAKVYGLRATAPAGRRVCNFPNCTCKVFDGTACEPEQTVAVRAASSDIVHRLRVAASEWLPTSEHTLRAHNLLEEAANALAYRPAQPAAQAEPVAVKFACWDADNGMETFDTHAEALEYATATLSYYRDDAKSDGEWPGDVDSMWVGAIHITHKPAATMPDDDGGVDYALQPVSTQPAAQGLGKEEPDKWAQYVAGMASQKE